ncbi:MAG: glycosyltransferase family 2 protein [Elusimicrobia bacterium]|nr:glycosyltransferase family 2 protein [Elusimicrobiota bacterium]
MISVSAVVPFQDEAEGAREALRELARALEPTGDWEIIAVDDASRDETGRILEEESRAEPRIRVVRTPCRRGLGAAIRHGASAACKDWLLYVDGDRPVYPEDLAAVLALTDRARFISARRSGSYESPVRRLVSFFYNRLVRALFQVRAQDVNFCVKCLPREAFRELDLKADTAFLNIELFGKAARRGLELSQPCLRQRPRATGRSKCFRPLPVLKLLRELASCALSREGC